jgi:hypothetical protein
MPRTSASARLIIPVDGQPTQLHPPPSLSEIERTIFNAVIKSCDPKHFRASDLPLLVRYVESCALGDHAAEQLRTNGAVVGGKPSPWIIVQEKAVRAMVALSLRLRLSPQSRLDPKTVARREPSSLPRPWEDK